MRKILAGLGLSLALSSMPALAQTPYSGIVIFGDSLSDTGNIPRFFGIDVPGPPYYKFMFSNGPVYGTYLDGLLGISAPLQDYAIGGATSGSSNVGGLPGNPLIGLPNAGVNGEITLYLASHPHPDPNQLFIVFAGGNDYLNLISGTPPAQFPALLQSPTGPVTVTVANIVADVTRLAAAGVRNFVVPNLPDLGDTPSNNGSPVTASEGLALTQTHDQALAQAMYKLQQQLHVNITIVDNYSVLNDIVANPGKYGITNTKDQCLQNAACVSQHLPYLFWDGVHPTGQVQAALADLFLSSLDGPTTIGAELELDRVRQQDLFDLISSRAERLRGGAGGLALSGALGEASVGANPDKPFALWVDGGYDFGTRQTETSRDGFSYDQTSFAFGADYRVTPEIALGALVGFARTKDNLENGLGAQRVDSTEGAVYALYARDGWHGDLAVTYSNDDWDQLDRNTFMANPTANASASGGTFGYQVEGGYTFQAGDLSFGPDAALRYAHYRIGSYAESGAVGVNEEVDGQFVDSRIGQFGLSGALKTAFDGMVLTPSLQLDLEHEFDDLSRTLTTRLVSQPSTFTLTPLAAGADTWARIGGGIGLALSERSSAQFGIDATLWRDGGEDYRGFSRVMVRF
jgi:outer membrane lipase/esterase